VDVLGDNSVRLNNLNHRKVRRPFSKKKEVIVKWSYSKKELGLKREFLAAMNYNHNQILLHCKKSATLEHLLNIFFHEYQHSQQSSFLYGYYSRVAKTGYWNHPLEKEANDFADMMVPLYWKENSWKFEK
jgi:hypothetical protein